MTELKAGLTVVTVMLVIPLSCFALVGYISTQQRYATFLKSQRTVLECRASVASGRDVEDICGAIPTLEDFN